MNTAGPSASRRTRILPSTSVSSPSRTRSAKVSSASASWTCWAVTSMPARSVRRSAIWVATSSLTSGSAEVTPAAALPVKVAQVPKTMRSEASRGATPTPWPGSSSSGAGVSAEAMSLVSTLPPATASSTMAMTSAKEASRSACTCSGGIWKSFSTRFLMRMPIRESRPKSMSGSSRGRSETS